MEQKIRDHVRIAQEFFRNRLIALSRSGGFTPDIYARFLSIEYHLTNGVQRHFLSVAAHPDFSRRKAFRKFLFDFANEEELHYLIAKKDLENMGRSPEDCPLDVKLWKSFFDGVIVDRPFLRLGGTCVLENITAGSRDILGSLIKSAHFLNEKNTRFIVIHQHGEDVPHGDQIIEAIVSAKLEAPQIDDLIEGIRISTILFLRMIDWCVSGDELADLGEFSDLNENQDKKLAA